MQSTTFVWQICVRLLVRPPCFLLCAESFTVIEKCAKNSHLTGIDRMELDGTWKRQQSVLFFHNRISVPQWPFTFCCCASVPLQRRQTGGCNIPLAFISGNQFHRFTPPIFCVFLVRRLPICDQHILALQCTAAQYRMPLPSQNNPLTF